MEGQIFEGVQICALEVRMAMLMTWAAAVAPLDVTPQMALFAAEEQQRLQKAVEPQVARA
jgi:hypothetical protein